MDRSVGDITGELFIQLLNKYVDLRYHVEENPLSHSNLALNFITSSVSEQTESTYFQPLSQPLCICG